VIRKFSSYGPVDINQHYYAPREGLIERGIQLLVGENQEQGGHYITYEFFQDIGKTHKPFENLDDTITESTLSVYHLSRRYERYLRANRAWLFQAIPRRSDLRPYEALYHFNLYRFLTNFLDSFGVQLIPEFSTGNGKIDLLFRHAGLRLSLLGSS